MNTVVIIDDEEIMVNMIKRYFESERNDYEVAATFTSAEDALFWLEDNSADLIITDIKMGKVSGIDMIEILLENGFVGKFMIISAYDEFEYAKKAVKFGVSDYLLKPIDFAELGETLDSIAEKLESEKNNRNTDDIVQLLYSEICYGMLIDNEDVSERCEKLDVQCDRIAFCGEILLVYIKNIQQISNYDDAILKIIANVLKIKFNGICKFYQGAYRNGVCAIIVNPGIDEGITENLIYEILGVDVKVTSKRFSSLEELFQIARHLDFYDDVSLLINYLTNKKEEKFKKLLHLIIEENDGTIPPRIISGVCTYIEKFGINKTSAILKLFYEKAEMADGMFRELDLKRKEIDRDFVSKVQRYINDHIQTGIKRDDVANFMNYHPVYFSRQFAKMFNMTFQDYITKIRIEKSLEFMKEGCDIEKLAGMVGYESSKYFSKNFKKQMGISPSQYYANLKEQRKTVK